MRISLSLMEEEAVLLRKILNNAWQTADEIDAMQIELILQQLQLKMAELELKKIEGDSKI